MILYCQEINTIFVPPTDLERSAILLRTKVLLGRDSKHATKIYPNEYNFTNYE